ncbi:Arm DNA-binding domain-containing protein [Sphingomonas sp. RHCKR7]|uniref:Arm DNA-binding domain-containing protein n=1 Tax=Sphingomonas folli TaxID=2862497 RepID=UPI001C66D95F|nr:Arm DNA-binding domain-containing protein [Sphingomonas folli]MBW6525823.1 Arm DNA-binding domain-containing protein [Sphingomonas folli]
MLTDLACRRAAPRPTAYKLSDAFGLYLYVLPSGYRSWRWKYRVAGKEKVLVFGPYHAVTLAKARQLREEAARSLREGIDPSISRRQRAAA